MAFTGWSFGDTFVGSREKAKDRAQKAQEFKDSTDLRYDELNERIKARKAMDSYRHNQITEAIRSNKANEDNTVFGINTKKTIADNSNTTSIDIKDMDIDSREYLAEKKMALQKFITEMQNQSNYDIAMLNSKTKDAISIRDNLTKLKGIEANKYGVDTQAETSDKDRDYNYWNAEQGYIRDDRKLDVTEKGIYLDYDARTQAEENKKWNLNTRLEAAEDRAAKEHDYSMERLDKTHDNANYQAYLERSLKKELLDRKYRQERIDKEITAGTTMGTVGHFGDLGDNSGANLGDGSTYGRTSIIPGAGGFDEGEFSRSSKAYVDNLEMNLQVLANEARYNPGSANLKKHINDLKSMKKILDGGEYHGLLDSSVLNFFEGMTTGNDGSGYGKGLSKDAQKTSNRITRILNALGY